MKKLSAILMALTLSVAVSGCTTTEQGAVGGAVGGALIGQAIGGNTESTLIGAGVGAVTGALIGKSLERRGYCRYRDRRGRIYEARCE
ncbi:MAG: glycine zipper domain-containing protein [Rhizobiaceae bacterium]